MKKLYPLLLTLAPALSLSAQPWCPNIGSQWWHTYAQVGGLSGHVSTTYTMDTLIEGESWQKLHSVAIYQDLSSSGSPIITEARSLFTRVADNTVFSRRDDEVDTLYRFDAEIGDRWSVPFLENPQLTYVVTGLGVRSVDGIDLSWLAVEVVTQEEGLYYLDTLVERLGFLEQYIDPEASLNLEPTIQSLRCYTDPEIDYHRQPDTTCEVILQVLNNDAAESTVSMRFDGESSKLWVQLLDARSCQYQLVDVSGKLHDQGVLRTGSTSISTADLPSGVYVLQVVDGKRSLWSRKWIKA